MWPPDVDDMAALYDGELSVVLDQLIPLCEVIRRPRLPDPWFDAEFRRLERAYAAKCRCLNRATSRGSPSPHSVNNEKVAAAMSA